MRGPIILIIVFILRFIFLPVDIEGDLNIFYHIFAGLCVGMTTYLIDQQIGIYISKRKNKNK